MSNVSELRACGSNVLLRRVRDRGSIIVHVLERYGETDRVLQVAEIVSLGNRVLHPEWRDEPLRIGDLVVYNQARVHDYFHWTSLGDGRDLLVYPSQWILGVVTSTLLDDASLREFEPQPSELVAPRFGLDYEPSSRTA